LSGELPINGQNVGTESREFLLALRQPASGLRQTIASTEEVFLSRRILPRKAPNVTTAERDIKTRDVDLARVKWNHISRSREGKLAPPDHGHTMHFLSFRAYQRSMDPPKRATRTPIQTITEIFRSRFDGISCALRMNSNWTLAEAGAPDSIRRERSDKDPSPTHES
jgi:hypothetical protein